MKELSLQSFDANLDPVQVRIEQLARICTGDFSF